MRILFLLLAVSVIGRFTSYAQLDADPNCPEAPVPRLIVDAQAMITPGSSNNVRDSAGRSGNQIGSIAGGEVINVLDGPVCSDGFNWWQVEYSGNNVGWTVEGTLSEYWIEPYTPEEPEATPIPEATATEEPPAEPPASFEPPIDVVNVLNVGVRTRVINDDPDSDTITLVVRTEPSRSGGVVAQALEDDTLTIIGGPEEADGLRWWQVETAKGSQGWVIEGLVNTGRNNTYERTLLPACPDESDRVMFRLGDFVMTGTPDGSDLCVFDYIYTPAWLTFSETLFKFDNVFLASPDGQFFVYSEGSYGPLIRLSTDGIERQILTEERVYWASISPDGKRIAIANGTHIATFNSDGSRYSTLTQGDTIRTWVEWLSDSETLIYLEQSNFSDQMGITIDYTIYRVNTQQGGFRPIVVLPTGFSPSRMALSTVTDQLAVGGTLYGLIDGMRGDKPVTFFDFENALDIYTQIVEADTGELILQQPSRLYDMKWTPDGETLVGYPDVIQNSQILSMTTGELTSLDLTGDPLPEIDSAFLTWESNTTYLVYVGYGFELEVSDFGIWEIDVSSGTVSQLR